MRHFVFNLALVSCSLFVFSITADAHPHKLGEMNHGPSLESYQIELDFSSNHWVQDDPGSNINVAKNNKNDKAITGKKEMKIKPHRKTNKYKNDKKNKENK